MTRAGRLRVVSGTARGRRIRVPEGTGTRPTSDRVREAVFNALYSLGVLDGARVFDLFAGSGALGIEALSRGAAHAHFVESAAPARTVLEQNLADLGFSDRATVIGEAVMDALASLPADGDLVLVDPPYAFDRWPALTAGLAGVVVPGAIAVLESDRSVEVDQTWEKMRERNYGGTVITFATRGPAPPAVRSPASSTGTASPPTPTQPTGADA